MDLSKLMGQPKDVRVRRCVPVKGARLSIYPRENLIPYFQRYLQLAIIFAPIPLPELIQVDCPRPPKEVSEAYPVPLRPQSDCPVKATWSFASRLG
mmetsp:Transcript_43115/g.113553  ORF Transcript_43115/g.113553 Transcript_43115/m.113553 type:complete len:96 (+) Transcript_43115:282-569(+)